MSVVKRYTCGNMTEDGLANVVLTSPDIAGMAVVTARAGVADGQTEIGFDVMAPDENRIYLPLIKLPLQTRAQAAAYARKRRSHEEEG